MFQQTHTKFFVVKFTDSHHVLRGEDDEQRDEDFVSCPKGHHLL